MQTVGEMLAQRRRAQGDRKVCAEPPAFQSAIYLEEILRNWPDSCAVELIGDNQACMHGRVFTVFDTLLASKNTTLVSPTKQISRFGLAGVIWVALKFDIAQSFPNAFIGQFDIAYTYSRCPIPPSQQPISMRTLSTIEAHVTESVVCYIASPHLHDIAFRILWDETTSAVSCLDIDDVLTSSLAYVLESHKGGTRWALGSTEGALCVITTKDIQALSYVCSSWCAAFYSGKWKVDCEFDVLARAAICHALHIKPTEEIGAILAQAQACMEDAGWRDDVFSGFTAWPCEGAPTPTLPLHLDDCPISDARSGCCRDCHLSD